MTEKEEKRQNKNLKECRVCFSMISKNATVCPHCGEKKPFKKGTNWKVIAIVGLFTYLFYSAFGPTEEELKQQKIETTKQQKIDKENKIKELLAELKKIPVSNYLENYLRYKKLVELDPSNKKYSDKYSFYKIRYDIQEKFNSSCRIEARKLIKRSLSHPSSYEFITYFDKNDELTYYYQEHFYASNSFGVKDKMVAKYVCTPVKEKNGKVSQNIRNIFFKQDIE